MPARPTSKPSWQQSATPWALAAAAVLWVLPWLLPTHVPPWLTFHSEWLAALALVPLALRLALQPARAALPAPTLALLALATVPLVQLACGQIVYFGDALLAALYIAGFGVAIALGAAWRRAAAHEAVAFVAGVTLCAALATFALALMQWLRVDTLGVLLAALHGFDRPAGNIAQANHMATLMAWGLVAAWGLYERDRLGRVAAALTATCLLFGIAMSQSRTGWIHVALLLFAALALRRRCAMRLPPAAALVLALGFAALVLAWPQLNATADLEPALSLARQASPGRRLLIWQQFAAAVAAAPWAGYGWTQSSVAQFAVALRPLPESVGISDPHDLLLALMTWQGVPLTLLVVGAAGAWCWRRGRAIRASETLFAALAAVMLLVHSMLEFPFEYAYFLLPAGVAIGIVEADTRGDAAPGTLPPRAWLAAATLATVLLAWLAADYAAIEDSLLRYRYEAAHVGSARGSVAPETRLLTQLGALMRFVRTEPRPGQDAQQLAAAERVVTRFPSGGNQFRLAQMWARNGQPQRARRVLDELCALQRDPNCERAHAAWVAQSAQDPLMRAVVPPTAAPGR